ncbi:3171_t:CDS:2, partial [Dentiscutata heterogama]
LRDKYINIIKKQEILDYKLFKLTKEKLKNLGILFGSAIRIINFIQKFSKKLKAFLDFTIKTDIRYILNKYRITEFIACYFSNQCLDNIKSMMNNMDSLRDYKKVVYSKYVNLILQESLQIAKQIIKKQIRLYSELEIISIEASDKVDYAFRISKIMSNLKELVCITETKKDKEDIKIIQTIVQLESTFYLNKIQKVNNYFDNYYNYIYDIIT